MPDHIAGWTFLSLIWLRVEAVASGLADRELLLEALTIHLGFATRRAVEDARKNRQAAQDDATAPSLARVLVDRRVLTAERAGVVELLADDLLSRHGGNLRQCLDALCAFGRLRKDLEWRLTGLESRHPTIPPAPNGKEGRRGGDEDDGNGASAAADRPGRPAASVGGSQDVEDDDEDDEEGGKAGDNEDYAWSLAAPGSTGGRFEILHPHARGGIGVVSVAFDSELQREVALKQIKSDSADDPDSRARFLLEAEVTGRLEHPGIVPVYGLGFDSQGRPYYAMRFVRGITLDEAISNYHAAGAGRGRDPRERALELRQLLGRFVNVCHTMAYAHSRGVLHRDLKPANVLLGPYNETLIVDWGLAKVLGRSQQAAVTPPTEAAKPASRPSRIIPPLGQSSSTDTVAGAAFGTPAFMSPEQAEGQLDRLGPASDLYSLGAVLYTLLCGRPPFESAWCEVTSLLAQVKRGEFSPPRQVSSGVPRPLEAICLKAMANRPEDRYKGAEELADDIERWLADEPVAAYREPASARMLRWGRRHRTLVAGAGALLTTAVAGLTLGIIMLGRAQRETEAQRLRAVQQSDMATFMSKEANNRAETLRRRDYINRVNLAHREFEDDNAALAEQILYGCPSMLRHWEWSHVQRLAHLELDTFVNSGTKEQFDVWSLAFSADGRRLVSGSGPWFQAHSAATAALVIREVDSGREIFARRGWKGAVQAVAISPDGRRVVAGTGTTDAVTRGLLTCHDATTGETLWQVEEREVNILSLAYSPDGTTIACGCGGFNNYNGIGYVRLRDAATGKETGQIPGGPGGVTCVAFSPDGKQLAVANRGLVDVWDVARRTLLFPLRGHLEFVYAVTFSPDHGASGLIATGGWDRAIRLWEARTGKLVRTLLGHRGFVRGLSFRPDSLQLVSCSEDRSLRLWDVASGRTVASFDGHMGFVHCVAFSPDGARVASGSMDGTVKIWPAAAPDPQVTFKNGSGWVGTAAFHPENGKVATAHNGGIRVWDPRTGEEFWRVIGPRGLLGRIGLCFSRDGKLLFASAPGGAVNAYDAATGRLVREVAKSTDTVAELALSPDGSVIAAAHGDGTISLWHTGPTTAGGRTLTGHSGAVNAVSFSSDGHLLASASEDQKVKVWDVATGKELGSLSGHVTGVKDVAFSPDGRQLASVGGQYRGSPAAEVFLWEWKETSGSLVRKLEGHTGLVSAVAYFPDGRRLVTASDDRSLKLWDPATGDDVFTLRGHTSGVVSLALSGDGKRIVSGSIDCTARVWSSEPPSAQISQVRRRAAVNLVQSLFETKLLKSEVLAALQSDQSLDRALRPIALEIARRRSDDAQGLYEAAWLTIVRPTGTPELYAQALSRLEAAYQMAEGDPDRQAEYQHILGLALLRAGHADRALQLVARLKADSPSGRSRLLPIDLAVTALANQKLGHFAEARSSLAELESLVRAGSRTDQEALGFLREVESVVHE